MIDRSPRHFHRPLRPAFTLIETLLALGLSSGLLIVVFGLVNSTAQYQVTGSDQLLASQRLLGLMQDLRYDLHLVDADPAWTLKTQRVNDADDALEEQLLQRTLPQVRVRSVEAAAEPIRLVGDSRALLITLSAGNPRFHDRSLNSIAGSQAARNSRRQILWTHSSSLPLTLPALAAGETAIPRTFDKLSDGGCLRCECWANPAETGNDRSSIAGYDVLSSARSVAFRYFDGTLWTDQWNSSQSKSLPVAIELKFEDTTSNRPHHWIVYLPQASHGQRQNHSMQVRR